MKNKTTFNTKQRKVYFGGRKLDSEKNRRIQGSLGVVDQPAVIFQQRSLTLKHPVDRNRKERSLCSMLARFSLPIVVPKDAKKVPLGADEINTPYQLIGHCVAKSFSMDIDL